MLYNYFKISYIIVLNFKGMVNQIFIWPYFHAFLKSYKVYNKYPNPSYNYCLFDYI